MVVGKGSNVLVSDGGFHGLVLRLGRGFRWRVASGDGLSAGASMPLPALAGVALTHGLTGLESGRPSRLVRRLGEDERRSARGELSTRAPDDRPVRRVGPGPVTVKAEEAGFAYRSSALPPAHRRAGRHGEALAGRARGDPRADGRDPRVAAAAPAPRGAELRQRLQEPTGDHSARLVDEAGRKGTAVGERPSPGSTRTSSSRRRAPVPPMSWNRSGRSRSGCRALLGRPGARGASRWRVRSRPPLTIRPVRTADVGSRSAPGGHRRDRSDGRRCGCPTRTGMFHVRGHRCRGERAPVERTDRSDVGLSPRDNPALARRVGGRGASPARPVDRASRGLRGRPPPDRDDQGDGTFTDRVDRARLRSNRCSWPPTAPSSRSGRLPGLPVIDAPPAWVDPLGATALRTPRRRCSPRWRPPVQGAASGRGRTGGAGAGVDGWTPGPVRAAGGLRGEGPRPGEVLRWIEREDGRFRVVDVSAPSAPAGIAGG